MIFFYHKSSFIWSWRPYIKTTCGHWNEGHFIRIMKKKIVDEGNFIRIMKKKKQQVPHQVICPTVNENNSKVQLAPIKVVQHGELNCCCLL